MRVSVRAIVINDNHLLVEVSAGISFPLGGRQEAGEQLEVTLARELKEEVPDGRFEIQRYIGKIFNRWSENGETLESHDHYFAVLWPEADVKAPVQAGEAGRYFQWVKLDQLERVKLMPVLLRGLLAELTTKPGRSWDLINDEVG